MTVNARRKKAGLSYKNELSKWDHVPPDLVAEGSDRSQPVVTIAIPTFRRPDFLVEAVQSAMALRFDRPYEIAVFDNDPTSTVPEFLLEQLPELAGRNFRYYRNRENLGAIGNWNHALQLGRGEWFAFLHDDDLLDDNFLTTMFSALDRRPQIDGLVCRKRWFGKRGGVETVARPSLRRAAKRLLLEFLFAGRPTRRVKAGKFFWGAILGNTGAGFIFLRKKGLQIGGFYLEDQASDHWFYARFAKRFELRQHRAVAASVRKTEENDSGNRETVKKQLEGGYRLQQTLAGSEVPEWWRYFSPLIAAHDLLDFRANWGADVSKVEMEDLLKIRLPNDHPYLLWTIRLVLRGF